jgi:hypothetical protein
MVANPLVNFYKRLPDEKKILISDYLAGPKKLFRYCTELRFKVYEDQEERFVYITSDEPETGFIEFFYPGAVVTRTGTIYAWSLRKFVSRHDKVMIDMHNHLARFFSDGIISVYGVRQTFDLSTPVSEIFKKKWIKDQRRKIQEFQPEFSDDPADLDFFIDSLYLPYIQNRHEDANILKKIFLKRQMDKNGDLCFLKKDGRIVAGALNNRVGDTYHFVVLGLIDDKYLGQGAIAALYYNCILRAQEKGAKYIEFGISRPFISDGLLNYKRRWGGQIRRDFEKKRVLYLKNIAKDGLIILDGEKLKVLASADNTECRKLCSDAGMEVKIIG